MALSRPFKEDPLALPFSTPLSSRRSMVWCPWFCARMWCLSASDLPRSKPLVRVAFPASLSARSFPFTPACPGQYTHRNIRRWMSIVGTFQSGLPIPLFIFCIKIVWICEDDGQSGPTVTSWGNPAEGMGDYVHLHRQAGGWDRIGRFRRDC